MLASDRSVPTGAFASIWTLASLPGILARKGEAAPSIHMRSTTMLLRLVSFSGGPVTFWIGLLLAGLMGTGRAPAQDPSGRIQPSAEHPRYWQYEGTPVVLIGGSKQDNLFQIPDLKAHLDRLVSVGGNYVRNTLSGRPDEGYEVRAFAQRPDGRYDLSEWNAEYWERLERFLALTEERDIIVQVEVWATWDFNYEEWGRSPWHPANNVNYSFASTQLQREYGNPMMEENDFWRSVPSLNDDETLLRHQKRFVDRVLSLTLEYDHVLYAVNNEMHPTSDPDWGLFWARYMHRRALERGTAIEVTQMYWTPEMRARGHRTVLEHPEVFDFFDASQNTSNKDAWHHWRNFLWVREALDASPRPITVVKTYGSEAGAFEAAPERMWRHLIMGAASTRFHRPPNSYGLDETARTHLRSMRMWLDAYDLVAGEPDGSSDWGGGFDRLADRERGEAYCHFVEGTAYSVYFPDGGRVELEVPADAYTVRWLDIEAQEWRSGARARGPTVELATPDEAGHWMAVVRAE